MSNEQWKPVKGFENYEVSSLGKVRNKFGKELSQQEIRNYRYINLFKDGKAKSLRVHRLVAENFIGEVYDQVDHINKIRNDNRVENLRLCYHRENQLYKFNSKYPGAAPWKMNGVFTGRYKAGVEQNGKYKVLGYFPTIEEASAKYLSFKAKLEEFYDNKRDFCFVGRKHNFFKPKDDQ